MENFRLRFKVKETHHVFFLRLNPIISVGELHAEVKEKLSQTGLRFSCFKLLLGKSELSDLEKTLTEEGLVSGDTLFVQSENFNASTQTSKSDPQKLSSIIHEKDKKKEIDHKEDVEDHGKLYIPLPISRGPSTNWTTVESVRDKLGQYPGEAATLVDQLAVMLHVLLLETGFRALSSGQNQKSLPDNWQWKSGSKNVQYVIDVDEKVVVVRVVMMQVGSALTVHGSVNKKLFTYIVADPSRYEGLHNLQELCISFKNGFSLPLLYATGCNVTQLSLLPPEVISNMAAFLDSKTTLMWSATGRRFREMLLTNKLWQYYYKRDYPKTYPNRCAIKDPDWFRLYREETLAVRALRKARATALVPFSPSLPAPIYPPVPYPEPNFPGPFGPPIMPGPFFDRPNPEFVGIGGNYEQGPAGPVRFQSRRRNDFGSLGRPSAGGFGGGFGGF